jgi:ferrochelatase
MSDAILIFSFGGPEKPEDVMPFLENVVSGRGVPRERLLEVAEHYYHFGGKSPINDHNRKMISDLEHLLAEQGPALSVYWGNRNWHPFLADTLERMANEGVTRALVFVTSAFGSYSGCRRYLEDLDQAAAKVREKVGAKLPELVKLRLYWNHPGFIEPMIDRVRTALERIPAERRTQAAMTFTAHSVPMSMAASSPYVSQLNEACGIVCKALGIREWKLVYQSRSGPPTQPWLVPDILDHLRLLKDAGVSDVVVVPIGFVSDHMEVLYDLDTEAKQFCAEIGLNMVRAGTAGGDPKFVAMIRELVLEQLGAVSSRRAVGESGPSPDSCPPGCCAVPQRPPGR